MNVLIREIHNMRAALLLLCFFYALKAQQTPVPQFPESVAAEVGDNVTLRCNVDGISTYCYTVVWTRVHPRTGTMTTCKNKNPGSSFRDTAKVCYYEIQNAAAEDSGIYYCQAVHGQLIYTGNGSTVVVREVNRTPIPVLEILWSSDNRDRSLVRLMCLASDVFPLQVRIYWVIEGEEESGMTESIGIKDDGSDMCQILLYGAISGAVITIIVAISIAGAEKSYRHSAETTTAWEAREWVKNSGELVHSGGALRHLRRSEFRKTNKCYFTVKKGGHQMQRRGANVLRFHVQIRQTYTPAPTPLRGADYIRMLICLITKDM
ncbi:hypothetical protein JZ751_000084 [Albula glossodonta]|uniref:Ig-like domain-containing protein n=1 Tax=Albula glossodonta TaxID=121402 RepID=A0A8T2PVJ4_9TELE|nr:hypothetical protein JZ751_000084 [Albula glossodonta]